TDNGATWANLTNTAPYSGVTTTTLTLTGVTTGLTGAQYRAAATNSVGAATSSAATLTVAAPPTITTQPADQSTMDGKPVSFTVAASGAPAPTYQWQISDASGAVWADVTTPSATTPTLSITAVTTWLNRVQFRC